MVSRRIRVLACGAAVLLTGAVWQPGNRQRPETDARVPKEAAVEIRTFQYSPAVLEITAGSRVTWTNQDEILHTVTSGAPEDRGDRFDVPLEEAGSVYSFTFSEPGTYSYFCDRHQFMRGQIIVKEAEE